MVEQRGKNMRKGDIIGVEKVGKERERETKEEKKKRKSFGGGRRPWLRGGFGTVTVHCITQQTMIESR